MAFEVLRSFKEANAVEFKNESSWVTKTWTAPPRSVYQLNRDAAKFENGECGLGVIIRNEKGKVMLSSAKIIPPQLDIETAEAQALLLGMTVAIEVGFFSLIAESDSLVKIQELKFSVRKNPYFGAMVGNIKALEAQFILISF